MHCSDMWCMNNAIRNLWQLIDDGMYVVDEKAVADAVVARAMVRESVAQVSFHSELKDRPARSFRRDSRARSFRLERSV
jgi:hypothetical protein